MSPKTAPVKWAQRKDSLYLTINLQDVKGEKVSLTEGKLAFSGTSGGQEYALDLDFLHEVVPDKSSWNVLPRSVQMHIMKKDEEGDFWERLLKDKHQEKNQVSIDWDKYVDEDEEDGGFDMSGLDGGQGFGGGGADIQQMLAQMGAGGGGGMGMGMGMPDLAGGGPEEEDSDDDDLPDLEDAKE